METILAPLDMQLGSDVWKQTPSPAMSSAEASPDAKSSLVRLPSLFAMTAANPSTDWSPRQVGMSDVLSAQVSPVKEKGLARLPSIGAMINRDESPSSYSTPTESLSPVQKHCMDLYKQLQDVSMSPSRADSALNSLLAGAALSQLAMSQPDESSQSCKILPALARPSDKAEKTKRSSNAKLCGMADCNKRAKAGGFCIAHGGGLRCSEEGCQKHAVSLGLCISHGGGKRCTVEGCLNASRKNGVCWSHGGKRLCKLEGCNKGPKSGGYCWSHGGKMKK
ncbi:hypothetical protein PHYBOEH_000442 [Phytophthora boehmeriae]|uniref:WRKY19-like zinc finger domain-containing protein n=1 Tax=Phytophthora boehmeriae TaxID=109152 RepID=A0A8T1WWR6_9STRA|nr:hypothetical protein PHYBOEH_000442 [Phytophthora boehmeriae]